MKLWLKTCFSPRWRQRDLNLQTTGNVEQSIIYPNNTEIYSFREGRADEKPGDEMRNEKRRTEGWNKRRQEKLGDWRKNEGRRGKYLLMKQTSRTLTPSLLRCKLSSELRGQREVIKNRRSLFNVMSKKSGVKQLIHVGLPDCWLIDSDNKLDWNRSMRRCCCWGKVLRIYRFMIWSVVLGRRRQFSRQMRESVLLNHKRKHPKRDPWQQNRWRSKKTGPRERSDKPRSSNQDQNKTSETIRTRTYWDL